MLQQNPIIQGMIKIITIILVLYTSSGQNNAYSTQKASAPLPAIYDESQGRWIMGGTFEGWIRDSNNKGLADVCVSAFTSPCGELRQQSVVTRSDGFFKLSGLAPHPYYIFADASCQSPQNLINSWWNGDAGTSNCHKAASVTIQDGESKSHINFILLPGKKINGQVMDQNKEIILDVCVAATDHCAKHWYSGANTDVNGRFSIMGLEPDIYYLHINPQCSGNKRIKKSLWWAGGHQVVSDCRQAVSTAINGNSTISDIVFQINVTPALKGHVQNSHKKPIANVCVNLKRFCEKEWFGSAMTDHQGNFSFVNLPEDTYYLETSVSCQTPQKYLDAWWNTSGGHPSCQKAEPIDLTAPGQAYDFTLKTGNMIQGRIVNHNQDPIPNICVMASSQCREIWYAQNITTETGNYFLIVPDGTYYLYTHSTCDSQNNLVDQWWNGRSGTLNCLNARGIQLKNKQVKQNIDFTLHSGGMLTGTILSNEKKPLPNTCIGITKNCDQPVMILQQADADGHYFQKLLAGSYYVRTDYSCKMQPTWQKKQHADATLDEKVYMDQWWGNARSVSHCNEAEPVVIQTDQSSGPIDFVLSSGGVVSGHLMSVDGKSLANIEVNIYDSAGQMLILSTYSQANGAFRAMLPSGSYLIRARPSRYRTPIYYIDQWWNGQSGSVHVQGAKQVRIKDNAVQKNILFKLQTGGAVTGMVFSPGQQPLKNIRIIASDPQKDIIWAYSSSNQHGQYVISGIPKGLQTIHFDSVGAPPHILYHWTHGAVTEHMVSVDVGQIKHIDPFILPTGGAISGRIQTQSGSPLLDVCVVAVQKCGNVYFGQAKTNDQGYYIIKGLPVGDYYVQTNLSCKDLPGDYIDMYWTEKKGTPVCKKSQKITVQKKHTTSEINFSLSKDVAFIGTVTSVSGDPIENVCVVVSDQCGTEWAGESLSDATGAFVITGIPPGSYFLHTEASCYKDQAFIDHWWHSIENTPDCKDAEPVELVHSNMKTPVQFILPNLSASVSVSESHDPLPEGRYEESIENGKVVITIHDNVMDLIVEGVPLENVLQVISKYTGIKVLLFGTLKEKIFFNKRQAKLDEILLDLINGRAGHIFIYSPDRLMTSYIFSKDGQLKPTALSANTASPPFQLNIKKPLSVMQPEEIEDILRAPDRIEEKIHTLGALIGYFDSPHALKFLGVALKDPDEEVRMMAISVMNDLKENHLAVDDLTLALDRDMSPAVRALAAEALGEIGDKRAVRPLMDAMNDRDAGVRDTVRRALNGIQGQP
ncbi:MAG: carboxypeptidase regulatory-like domain-containing protein [Candidatus Magnetomorum sp.]|nr:carboxypeptidase regulatory-like domain-containing protein [Candidatus Magnetomorum sp.]